MMVSHTIEGPIATSLLAASLVLVATNISAAEGPCAPIARQTSATVIAYEPPALFTICRAGSAVPDVVAGRPVYVELVAHPGVGLFHFRVHGRATQIEPTGLRAMVERIDGLHAGLEALGASTQTIEEATSAAPAPFTPVDQSRALYLGIVTPRFRDTLSAIADQLEELPAQAGVLSRSCAELQSANDAPPLVVSDLRDRCNDSRAAPAEVEKEVGAMHGSIETFRASREAAREALVAARAKGDDAARQDRAVASLDQARRKALDVIEQARRLAPVAALLASEAWLIREALRGGTGSLRPGVPHYLTRFSQGGTATLQIDATPIELLPAAEEPTGKPPANEESSETFRFPVVSLHFLDIEAGIAAVGGPLVPSVGAQGVITGENIDEFVGLGLVEIEPARFLWPDSPLAGLLRFPVVGVPFTRDPTKNFFGGIGLGWTEVGSISAGPYLFRGVTLDRGFAFGETLPQGQSLSSISSAELRVGYFASASVDLAGLVHLFLARHQATLDATTGSEAR